MLYEKWEYLFRVNDLEMEYKSSMVHERSEKPAFKLEEGLYWVNLISVKVNAWRPSK